ncbi:hypothetical protein Tco_1581757 [Tanacetum coccineum]
MDSGTKGLNTNKEEHNVDDQQFIVHGTGISEDKSRPAVTPIVFQDKSQDKSTTDKQAQLTEEEQALQDELNRMITQETLAKAHEDDQRLAFENEKRRVAAEKRERAKGVTSLNTARPDDVFQSTANTPFQSAASTPTGFFEAGQSSLIDVTDIPDDPNMPELEDTDDKLDDEGIFKGSSFDDENSSDQGAEADFNNMDNTIDVSPIPTLRIHKHHTTSQIIGPPTSGVQTRRKAQGTSTQHKALLSFVYKQNRTNHKDQQTCLFACFLSQEEPKKVSQALADESWVAAIQEELLQFM